MGRPKRPASHIKSDLGRAPPAKHDGHRGPLLRHILGGGDHPPRGTRRPPRGTRHSPPGTRDGLDVGRGKASTWDEGGAPGLGHPRAGTRDGLDVGRGTASTWDEGPPLAWDTLVLGHRRAWDSLLETNGRLNQLNTSKLKKKKKARTTCWRQPLRLGRGTASPWDEGAAENTRSTFFRPPGPGRKHCFLSRSFKSALNTPLSTPFSLHL